VEIKQLERDYNQNIRSRWWYLVPILFGLVGGVIGYFALRKDDPHKAKNCLILGGILTIFNIVMSISLSAVFPFEPDFNPGY